MQILKFNGTAGNLTVGIIGTEEQGVKIKSKVLALCDESIRERISFLVPKEGITTETMISGAENTCRRGGASSSILWLACTVPELFPENVTWPSEVLFVVDYIPKDSSFFDTLNFVPRFATIDEFASIVCDSIRREVGIERANMEIARLRAEKFKLNKKTEELEKTVVNAGQSMEKINKLWRYRTRGLRFLFVFFFLLSSVLLGWVSFETLNPAGAMRLLAKTHIRITGKAPDFSFLAPFIERSPQEQGENADTEEKEIQDSGLQTTETAPDTKASLEEPKEDDEAQSPIATPEDTAGGADSAALPEDQKQD